MNRGFGAIVLCCIGAFIVIVPGVCLADPSSPAASSQIAPSAEMLLTSWSNRVKQLPRNYTLKAHATVQQVDISEDGKKSLIIQNWTVKVNGSHFLWDITHNGFREKLSYDGREWKDLNLYRLGGGDLNKRGVYLKDGLFKGQKAVDLITESAEVWPITLDNLMSCPFKYAEGSGQSLVDAYMSQIENETTKTVSCPDGSCVELDVKHGHNLYHGCMFPEKIIFAGFGGEWLPVSLTEATGSTSEYIRNSVHLKQFKTVDGHAYPSAWDNDSDIFAPNQHDSLGNTRGVIDAFVVGGVTDAETNVDFPDDAVVTRPPDASSSFAHWIKDNLSILCIAAALVLVGIGIAIRLRNRMMSHSDA